MDAAGVARRTRHPLDRAQNARPTSAHTHFPWSLTTARNIEGTEPRAVGDARRPSRLGSKILLLDFGAG